MVRGRCVCPPARGVCVSQMASVAVTHPAFRGGFGQEALSWSGNQPNCLDLQRMSPKGAELSDVLFDAHQFPAQLLMNPNLTGSL